MTFTLCLAQTTEPQTPQLTAPSTPAVSATQPSAGGVVAPRSEVKTDIQQFLAQVVEAGVSKGESDKLLSYLAEPVRQRIGNLKESDWTDLDGRIDQFRKDWQAKYGQEFKLLDKQSVVFVEETFPIHPGKSKNRAATQPATESSVEPSTGPATNIGNSAPQEQGVSVRTADVQLPVVKGQPPVTLNLINEGKLVGEWKINLPDNVDSKSLHDSLLKGLTTWDEDKAAWPTEINEGYQALSRVILTALAQSAPMLEH